MLDHKALIPTMAAAALLFASPTWSQRIDEVEPRQGFIDGTTKVAVLGSDFESGSRVLLRPGAPFPLSELPSRGAAALVAGRRAVTAASRSGVIDVIVFDLQDPSNPQELGRASFGGGERWPLDVAVDGNLVFVISLVAWDYYCEGAVDILGIENPDSIRRIGGFYFGYRDDCSSPFRDLAIDEDRVHVLDADGILGIWDIRDPGTPRRLGSTMISANAWNVTVDDSAAYLALGDGGLEIVDLSDPAAPVSTGLVADLEEAWDIALVPPYGYVAAGTDGVRVFDFTDPWNPVETGSSIPGATNGIHLAENRAFVLPGMNVLGLDDPLRPAIIGGLQPRAGFGGSFQDATDEVALLAEGSSVFVYDIGASSGPEEVVGRVLASGDVDRDAAGTYYLHGGSSAVSVEIHDPTRPVALASGHVPLARNPNFHSPRSAVLGRNIYSALSWTCPRADGPSYACSRLFRIDLQSDPSPSRGEHLYGWTVGMAADEANLYLAQKIDDADGRYREDWLVVREAGDPGLASAVRLEIPSRVGRISASEGRAFIAYGAQGLIVDARDRSAPFVSAGLDFAPYDAEMRYGLAYVSSGDLIVMDPESEPGVPVISRTSIAGDAKGIAVDGNRVVVATDLGVVEVDVSNPERPQVIRLARTPARDVEPVDGNHALLSGGEVIRLNPRIRGTSVIDAERLEVEVPPGFAPGMYDVVILSENGAAIESSNAFLVCERRDLQADLVSVTDPSGYPGRPPRFTVDLDGDPTLFKDISKHEVSLPLPELPAAMVVRFESGDGLEGTRIDLWVAPSAGSALAIVYDEDRVRAERVWNEAREAGRFRLPQLDARTYGPVALSLGPIPDRPAWTTVPVPGDVVGLEGPADRLRFRYEVIEDRLIAARVAGNDADLVVEAVVQDDVGCLFEAGTSLRDAVASWCEDATGGLPVVIQGCSANTDAEVSTGLTGR